MNLLPAPINLAPWYLPTRFRELKRARRDNSFRIWRVGADLVGVEFFRGFAESRFYVGVGHFFAAELL